MNGSNRAGADASRVIDMKVIDGLRELGGDDDPGLLLEVIGMFLDDAPTRIQEIELGFANGDVKLLERAAHSLKSASANVGAVELSTVCKRIEEIARRHTSEGVAELIPESNKAWTDAAAALRAIRG